MGSASLFLLLSVVACVCVAAPRSNGASSTYINALAERSQHLRHRFVVHTKTLRFHVDDFFFRRDACSDALDKASQEPYSTCVQMLGPIEIGNPATKEAVTAYCTSSQDCPAKVKELFQGIGAACGGGVRTYAATYEYMWARNGASLSLSLSLSLPQGFPELETAIYDECAVDLRGIYCGIDYFAMFNDTTLEQANNVRYISDCYHYLPV